MKLVLDVILSEAKDLDLLQEIMIKNKILRRRFASPQNDIHLKPNKKSRTCLGPGLERQASV
jgi:hypothetical protein